jgi:hypothetical protein
MQAKSLALASSTLMLEKISNRPQWQRFCQSLTYCVLHPSNKAGRQAGGQEGRQASQSQPIDKSPRAMATMGHRACL